MLCKIFEIKPFYSQWLQMLVQLQGCRQFVKIVESSIRRIIQQLQKALQFVLTKFRTCAVRHNPKFDNTNEIHDISSNIDFLNYLWDKAYHMRWNRVEEFHGYLRISVKSTKCHYFQKVTNLFCLCWRCTRKRGFIGIYCLQSRNPLPKMKGRVTSVSNMRNMQVSTLRRSNLPFQVMIEMEMQIFRIQNHNSSKTPLMWHHSE